MDQRGRCRLVFSVFSFFQFFVSGGYEELVNKWSTHSRSSKSICMQSQRQRPGTGCRTKMGKYIYK